MRQFMQWFISPLVGCLMGLVIVEIGLRVIGFTYPAWEIRDPDLGFVGLPGAEGACRVIAGTASYNVSPSSVGGYSNCK